MTLKRLVQYDKIIDYVIMSNGQSIIDNIKIANDNITHNTGMNSNIIIALEKYNSVYPV